MPGFCFLNEDYYMIVLAEFNCNCSFVCSGYQKREKVVVDFVYGKIL